MILRGGQQRGSGFGAGLLILLLALGAYTSSWAQDPQQDLGAETSSALPQAKGGVVRIGPRDLRPLGPPGRYLVQVAFPETRCTSFLAML